MDSKTKRQNDKQPSTVGNVAWLGAPGSSPESDFLNSQDSFWASISSSVRQNIICCAEKSCFIIKENNLHESDF